MSAGGTERLRVEKLHTPGIGDRSYVAHDGADAVVVDPQRDVERVEAVLERSGLRLRGVLETHVHNDYVTGGHALARRHGARYVLDSMADGEELEAGGLLVRAIATPGHTDTHLAYAVGPALFTGGSLLYGGVGRTDLVDPARTEELARAQFRSVRRLAEAYGPQVAVYPTHGFGGHCGAGSPADPDEVRSLAREREVNEALRASDEDAFVAGLVAGFEAYPAYYDHMAAINLAGPGPVRLRPPPVAERVDGWAVDLRPPAAYAKGHLPGTLNIAAGDPFATWVGWLVPWGAPLTLLAGSPGEIAAAQLALARIGIDSLAGVSVAGGDGPASYPVVTFRQIARGLGPDEVVLDVRTHKERARAAVRGSLHIPLPELPGRLGEVAGRRAYAHCGTGYRAGIAASLLDRAGMCAALIDDDFDQAGKLGLT